MLQFLLHPSGPLPRWVRSRLADAVAESPGIGAPVWVDAIQKIRQTQRERYEAKEVEVGQLRAKIAYWLEGDRYDPGAGAPLETLLTRTQRVSAWASAQFHTVESAFEAGVFAAAHAQAEALLTELAGLREGGAERIARLELERRIDEVTTDAPDPSTYEEGRSRTGDHLTGRSDRSVADRGLVEFRARAERHLVHLVAARTRPPPRFGCKTAGGREHCSPTKS